MQVRVSKIRGLGTFHSNNFVVKVVPPLSPEGKSRFRGGGPTLLTKFSGGIGQIRWVGYGKGSHRKKSLERKRHFVRTCFGSSSAIVTWNIYISIKNVVSFFKMLSFLRSNC